MTLLLRKVLIAENLLISIFYERIYYEFFKFQLALN